MAMVIRMTLRKHPGLILGGAFRYLDSFCMMRSVRKLNHRQASATAAHDPTDRSFRRNHPEVIQSTPRAVAILGAGASGMAVTKCCLEEGLKPVTFEQHGDIGGTYYMTKEKREGQRATAYKGLILNTSKEASRFSDFKMPDEFPKFLTADMYKSYLDAYAHQFGLKQHVQFNTKVLKVEPVIPGSVNGKWKVYYRDPHGSKHMNIFDDVVACTGAFSTPKFPVIPGLGSFDGLVMHVHSFKDPRIFQDMRVLVIGNQHSAGDMCVLSSRVARKVVLSMDKCETYLVPRVRPDGLAVDSMVTRIETWLTPKWLLNRRVAKIAQGSLDHKLYGLAQKAKPYGTGTIVINDHLAFQIGSGSVRVRPRVQRFSGNNAIFTNGSEEEFDAVICATGYSPDFKIIEWKPIQEYTTCDTEKTRKGMALYKWVFPLEAESPTIACVGNAQTFGSILPVFETQARWIARVFSGKCLLPSPSQRMAHWEKQQLFYDRTYGGKGKNFFWDLMDEMSEEFGAKPTFWKLLMRNPLVAYHYVFGPALPVQYRLVGPGSREEAWQDAITSCQKARQRWHFNI